MHDISTAKSWRKAGSGSSNSRRSVCGTRPMGLFAALRCKMRRENPAFCAAFTLVELLVTISIIGILAGLLVGLAGVAKKKGTISRVEAELGRIDLAIGSYKSSMNFYPPDNYNDVTRTDDT